MNRVWMIIFLLIIWCGFSNNFSLANLILGLCIATMCNFLVVRQIASSRINMIRLLKLIGYMLWQLIKSSIEVAWDVITPTHLHQPELIEIPLACTTDIEKTLLANLLSLTPGTLSIDLNKQNNHLIIHAMFAQDKQKIIDFVKNNLEAKLLKVFNHD